MDRGKEPTVYKQLFRGGNYLGRQLAALVTEGPHPVSQGLVINALLPPVGVIKIVEIQLGRGFQHRVGTIGGACVVGHGGFPGHAKN
jgi:hypothetical protein